MIESLRRTVFAIVTGSVVISSAPAQALLDRAWVSKDGADGPACGSAARPCRKLQFVHDNIVAAGGVVDIMDSAGYGPLVITKSLSVVNDGAGVAGVLAAPQGVGILVDTPAGSHVLLRGLTVEGPASGGADGIVFAGAGNLTVEKCLVRHFDGPGPPFSSPMGILITPKGSATFTVTDTTISDIGLSGLLVQGGSTTRIEGVVSRVSVTSAGSGIVIDNQAATARIGVTVVDSAVAFTTIGFGVVASSLSQSTRLTLRNALAHDNASGVYVDQFPASPVKTSFLELANSVVTDNTTGVEQRGGVAYSYGDNSINGNGTDIFGALTPLAPQ